MIQKKPLFSFGVIADVQYCSCEPAGVRYYRKSVQKLNECLQELNQHSLSFILDMGDLIDRDYSSFDDILEVYDQAKTRVYRSLGNHDFDVSDADKTKVSARLGMDKAAYYDFTYLGWRFIMLNGNEVSTYAHPAGSVEAQEAEQKLAQLKKQNAPNAQSWNGGISEQQLKWLALKLEEASQQMQKIIVCCHFPAYPKDPHNLWNDTEVQQLLSDTPQVVAYFNGHNHGGNYAQKDHVHYLNFKGMVDTASENTFAIADVYPDYLNIRGFGREDSRQLKFS
ncbi:hypothetical protein PZB74_10440 [Porifericola rhodea]|uniref:metallophosphoesterase n=1 Tax=Porifericola rhodea TaxID=930972 RepID=UPI002665AE05|nr:metallophosphoesterase [Porifericola rhodea]WKN33743.1 hypothetical protein PZB74_10440 [Porifericola rhodea]